MAKIDKKSDALKLAAKVAGLNAPVHFPRAPKAIRLKEGYMPKRNPVTLRDFDIEAQKNK